MGGIIIFTMRHEIYAGRKMRKKGSVRLQRDISSRRPEHNRQSSLGAAAITHSDSGRRVGTVCKGWRMGCCFQTKGSGVSLGHFLRTLHACLETHTPHHHRKRVQITTLFLSTPLLLPSAALITKHCFRVLQK